MEYKSARYIVFCRVLGFLIKTACYIAILALTALSTYTFYDGIVVNREPDGIHQLRGQISDSAEAFVWPDEMVAWLKIDGTHIDYPVMQGGDNKWYLTHDYLGREAMSGSVFLDYRNRQDFSDDLSIIYGHRMNNDLMFSDVAKFADAEYFEEHRNGLLKTPNGEYELRVVAHNILSAEDNAYEEVSGASLGLGSGKYLLLSTCNRSGRMKRDVLIMEIKKRPNGLIYESGGV